MRRSLYARRFSSRGSPVRFASAVLGCALAWAQTSSLARAEDAAPQVPERVEVSGKKRDASAASDMDIPIGALGDVPRRNAEQLLTLAPGIFLSNPSGEGHASSIFLRGFDAGEGQDLEMRVEGVPINEPSNAHAHGYADTHFIIPELVQRLRVIEGPFDARQGDFAVAGSIHYHLGLPHRGVMTRAAYGSFNTRRLLALWGPSGTSTRTFAGVDYVEGDGFGPNRAHASVRAMAQYEHALGKQTFLTGMVQSYAGRFDAAGVLRQDDFSARRNATCADDVDAQFFCVVDRNQGGNVGRHGLSMTLERRAGDDQYQAQLFAFTRDLRIRQNLTGFIGDVGAGTDPQRGDGLEQAHRSFTVGSRGAYTRRFELFGRRHEAEVGYVARHDIAEAGATRVRFADTVPYRTDVASDLHITNIGLYASARVSPVRRWNVRAGLRLDAFSFAVQDNNRPLVDRSGQRLPRESLDAFGLAVQPKISSEVFLLDAVRWVASFGIGTRSSDAQALSQGEFAPFARVHALETGVVATTGSNETLQTESRALVYYTRVERDLLFDESQGRNTPIGASNRFGALAASRMRIPFGLEAQTSLTYAEAFVPPSDASLLELTKGPRLPYIPRWVARLDGSLRREVKLLGERFRYNLAAGFSYVAPRPLPFGELGPAFGSLDLAARVRWRQFELGVEATNVLDRRNKVAIYNYPSNFRGPTAFASLVSQQHFAAGPPRMVMATLSVYFDAKEDGK
jgi:hypothetical protein